MIRDLLFMLLATVFGVGLLMVVLGLGMMIAAVLKRRNDQPDRLVGWDTKERREMHTKQERQ